MKNILLFLSLIVYTFSTSAINAPGLVSPSNGATSQDVYLMLDWSTVSSITYYDVELDTTSDFNSSLYQYNEVGSGSSYTYKSNLLFNTTYYWRVRTRTASDTSEWSSTWSFTTRDYTYLTAPSNNSTNQDVYIMLDWYAVTGISYYDVELDTTPDFNSSQYQYSEVGSGSSYTYKSNLLFNTTYYWRVRSRHSADTTQWSSTWSFTTRDYTYLTTPANNATNQDVYIMLDWYAVTGISYYDVELDTTPDFNSPLYQYSEVSSGSSYTYKSNLLFNTTYYWRVRSRHSADTTQWSSTWNFTTHDYTYLTAPSNNSTNQDVYIMLDWYAVTGISYYDVELDTTPDFNSSLYQYSEVSSGSSYTYKSNLLFNTTYYWRVRSRHSADTTQWSSTWSFTTHDYTYLTAPSNGSTNQSISVLLDWYTVTGISYYDVELDTTPDFSSSQYRYTSVSSSSSSVTQSNLLFNTTYYWRARARHSADTTQWSSVWHFTTTGSITNVSPSNGATNQAISLTLDWTALTGNNGYIYQIDTTPDFDSPMFIQGNSSINSSEIGISNLYFGTTYYWRAAVISLADTSEWSSTWHFTTTNSTTNVSPSNGATGQLTSLTLDWTALTGNNGYIYQIDTTPDFDSPMFIQGNSAVNSSEIGVSNLYFGTTYYWRAAVISLVDTTQWSSTWHFTTAYSITNVSPSNGATNVSINPLLDWNAFTGNNGYLCEIDTSPNFNSGLHQVFTSSINSSQYTVSGLLYGTTYYWHAAVKNGVDTSYWSSTWKFTTSYELTEAPILDSPANDSLDVPYTSTYLTWNQSTGATSYQYEYSTDASFNTGVYSGYTSLTYKSISNLQPLTVYYWRVRGMNNSGSSPWSTIWTFTTQSAPLVAPTLVSPSNNTTGIVPDEVTLDWESVFGATEYTYEISPDINFGFAVTSLTVNETQATLLGLESSSDYYWHVKSTDGVTESDWSATWKFTTTFGINVNEIENQEFKIYPNPTTGIVIIEGDDAINYEIVDITGHIIYSNNMISNKEQIDLRNYGKGIYFVNIYNDKSKIVKKLVVK